MVERALKSPDGDLVTFFDNIGRYIIQNYRVWTKKSSLADIISTVAHIILNKRVFYKISPNQNLLTGTKVLVQRKFKKEWYILLNFKLQNSENIDWSILRLIEIVQCENSLVDIRKNEIEKENACNCSNTLCNSV